MAKFRGTKGNDVFTVSTSTLAGSSILGGTGYDTIKLTNTGKISFSAASAQNLAGIDAIDLSAHKSGWAEVLLNAALMDQSDGSVLTITSGAGGIDLLKADASIGGTVIVAGTGDIYLADNTNNAVTIKDDATVTVLGGTGDDTIIASATGSVLDGGAGDDLLVAGQGSDTVRFGTGDRADLVTGFNTHRTASHFRTRVSRI